MNIRPLLGLTFDDVLLVPKRSPVRSRGDVSTATQLSRHITMEIPIVSANMDTVIGDELAEVHTGRTWIGRRGTELEAASGARLAFITRYGQAFIPHADTVIQEGDLIHALFAGDVRERVEQVFEHGAEGA